MFFWACLVIIGATTLYDGMRTHSTPPARELNPLARFLINRWGPAWGVGLAVMAPTAVVSAIAITFGVQELLGYVAGARSALFALQLASRSNA